MDVTITERSPVDFDLDIRATKEELKPRLNKALKAQRKQMNLKGFRPGRVPMSLAKRMHGEEIAAKIAEEVIGEAYRDEVADDPDRDVLGQPLLAELDFGLDEDLHAVVRFGVRPAIEIADLSGVQVSKLVRPITDEDIEDEIQRRLRRQADLVPTEEPATEDDVVVIDMQRLDRETDTPIIGERQEGQQVELDDERLYPDMKTGLVGKKAGDTFKLDLPSGDETDRFLVTMQEVKTRELPALDEAFIKEQTADKVETIAGFQEMIRGEMEQAWDRMSSEMMREEMVRGILEAHDFAVPETLVEGMLNQMTEDYAKQNDDALPPGFDHAHFREANRETAENQVRWMLVRDQLAEEENLELSEDDFEAEFERMSAGGPFDAETLKGFIAQQPQLLEGIQQRIGTDKLFQALEGRFAVVEKTQDELEAEQAAKADAEEA
ncbi:MAG: trigger factor [Bacteroidota bacterium]